MRGLLVAVLLATTTAATETLFDLFGISQVELPGLDDSQLKKLYKRRALELHPDKSDHPDAEDRFRRLQEAYEGLKAGARADAALLELDGTLDLELLREIAQPHKPKGKKRGKGGRGGSEADKGTHRAPPDPLAYVISLRWLSAMYLSGVCADYRWAYDGASPELEAIIVDEEARGGGGMWAERQRKPLPPLAIALSLIPSTYKELILEPVQGLMDPESPIGELFEVCETCERLRDTLGEASAAFPRTDACEQNPRQP